MTKKIGVFGLLILGALLGWMMLGDHSKPTAFDVDESRLSEMELAGKRLFEDKNLSEPKGVACASCHVPGQAFSGNNGSSISALALGSRPENFGTRNAPALAYSGFSPAFHVAEEKLEDGSIDYVPTGGQFLDGRAADMAEQVAGPMMHPKEMNMPSKAEVVARVKAATYAPLLKKLHGEDVFDDAEKGFAKIAMTIAAFEHSAVFAPFASKFDAVLRGQAQFTPQEAKGFALFKDVEKGNCIGCHVGDEASKDPRDWLFTDFTYDNLAVPRNAAIPENKDATYVDLGLCKQPGIEKHTPKGVDAKSWCGAFKVPTLRNATITGPYMHNGKFDNLRDVVKFYVTRETNPEQWYAKNADGSVKKYDDLPKEYHGNVNTAEVPYDRKAGEKPRLNDEEIDAITAFLKTLTDEPKYMPKN